MTWRGGRRPRGAQRVSAEATGSAGVVGGTHLVVCQPDVGAALVGLHRPLGGLQVRLRIGPHKLWQADAPHRQAVLQRPQAGMHRVIQPGGVSQQALRRRLQPPGSSRQPVVPRLSLGHRSSCRRLDGGAHVQEHGGHGGVGTQVQGAAHVAYVGGQHGDDLHRVQRHLCGHPRRSTPSSLQRPAGAQQAAKQGGEGGAHAAVPGPRAVLEPRRACLLLAAALLSVVVTPRLGVLTPVLALLPDPAASSPPGLALPLTLTPGGTLVFAALVGGVERLRRHLVLTQPGVLPLGLGRPPALAQAVLRVGKSNPPRRRVSQASHQADRRAGPGGSWPARRARRVACARQAGCGVCRQGGVLCLLALGSSQTAVAQRWRPGRGPRTRSRPGGPSMATGCQRRRRWRSTDKTCPPSCHTAVTRRVSCPHAHGHGVCRVPSSAGTTSSHGLAQCVRTSALARLQTLSAADVASSDKPPPGAVGAPWREGRRRTGWLQTRLLRRAQQESQLLRLCLPMRPAPSAPTRR